MPDRWNSECDLPDLPSPSSPCPSPIHRPAPPFLPPLPLATELCHFFILKFALSYISVFVCLHRLPRNPTCLSPSINERNLSPPPSTKLKRCRRIVTYWVPVWRRIGLVYFAWIKSGCLLLPSHAGRPFFTTRVCSHPLSSNAFPSLSQS
ncbi:hypothetical protein BT69DRAFT_1004067 [Atractiella rhizophila]|nr:hypothetical protein BT69DRAFT_1004067 [Atractiella rhizophila]